MIESDISPTGRPTRERAARIDALVVEATIRAFTAIGFDFRMDQIAASAGLGKKAIYRRWPTKIELLIHAIDRHIEERQRSTTAGLPSDPVEALRELAWRIFSADKEALNRLSIFLQAEALRNDRLRYRLLDWREATLDVIERYVRPTVASADRDEVSARALAEILLDTLSGANAFLAWSGGDATEQTRVFESRWNVLRAMLR